LGCLYQNITCPTDVCTTSTCDFSSGLCVNSTVVCDTPQNDCQQSPGICVLPGGCQYENVSCPGDFCNLNGSCVPGTGCIYAPRNCTPSTPNACFENFVCNATLGMCVNSSVVCTNSNPCTNPYCDHVLGCQLSIPSCSDGCICTIDYCDLTGTSPTCTSIINWCEVTGNINCLAGSCTGSNINSMCGTCDGTEQAGYCPTCAEDPDYWQEFNTLNAAGVYVLNGTAETIVENARRNLTGVCSYVTACKGTQVCTNGNCQSGRDVSFESVEIEEPVISNPIYIKKERVKMSLPQSKKN